MIRKKRLKDEQKEEEKDADFSIEDRMKRRLRRQMAKVDKYTEAENKLREEQKRLLDQVASVVDYHEKHLEQDIEYQINVRKSLAVTKGAGLMGDLTGKGYVEMERKGDRPMYTQNLPETSDVRFQTIDTLPKIASKYRNTNKGFFLRKMTKRNPDFMVSPAHGTLLSNEQKG